MRRVVLIGAGATIPFYSPPVTTGAITSWLLDSTRWVNLLDRHRQVLGDGNEIEDSELLADLARFQSEHPTRTFEDLVEFLDRKAEWALDPRPGASIASDIFRFLNCPVVRGSSVWLDVPFLARQLIAEALAFHDKNHRVCSFDVLKAKQRQLFAALADACERLTIASLNYDETLPSSITGLPIETGFDGEDFNVKAFCRAPHVLMYPHGHVTFVPTSEGIRCLGDGDAANKARLEGLGRNDGRTTMAIDSSASRDTYGFNTFLVSGVMKDGAFNKNPFSAYYQRLAGDLLDADEVLVLGYSFGDTHLNRLLSNFLDLRSENQILIVDYLEPPIDVAAEYLKPGSFVNRVLHGLFKRSLPVRLGDGPPVYRLASKVVAINAIGRGWLYPRVFLCKSGYETFLTEHEEAIRTFSERDGHTERR